MRRGLVAEASLPACGHACGQDPKGLASHLVNLDWPTQMSETEFFKRIKQFPKSKTYKFPP